MTDKRDMKAGLEARIERKPPRGEKMLTERRLEEIERLTRGSSTIRELLGHIAAITKERDELKVEVERLTAIIAAKDLIKSIDDDPYFAGMKR